MSKCCECECSRSKQRQRLQDIQVIKESHEEIMLLQIFNEKLNGDGVYGRSYTELDELESMLRQGLCSVKEQQEKAYAEITHSQIAECEVMGGDWVDKNDDEDFAYQDVLARRRKALRHKARELRLSPLDSQQVHNNDHKVLMEVIESLKSEKERLRLWNQRMIGKELDGMGYHELVVFKSEILDGLLKVKEEMVRIKRTRQAEANGELISPGTDMITIAKLPLVT